MTRRRTILAAFAGAFLVLTGLARAQDGSTSPTAAPTEEIQASANQPDSAAAPAAPRVDTLADRVQGLWFAAQPHLASGAIDAARDHISELVSLREERGIAGFPILARAVAVFGFKAIDSGDASRAKELFEIALKLDPAVEEARQGLAVEAGKGDPVTQLRAATFSRLSQLRALPFVLSTWSIHLGFGLLVVGILLTVSFVLRHQATIRHDIEELLKQTSSLVAASAAWIVLLLPLILTFDLYWACLFWAVLVGAYLSQAERIVLSIAVILCSLALPSVTLADWWLGGGNDVLDSVAARHLEGMTSANTVRRFEAYAEQNPGDTPAQLLLAKMYERNGQQQAALDLFKRLTDTGRSADVLNNLGNFYYRRGEKELAFQNWQAATEADQGFAPAHYNLSIFYVDAFAFDKKEEHFNKAKSLNADLINRTVAKGSGLLDTGIDATTVRARVLRGGGRKDLLERLLKPQVIAALIALVLLHVLAAKRGDRLARLCNRCGEAFCRDCKPGKDKQDLCLQCVHLFLRKDGVSPQMRAEKLAMVGRHQSLKKFASIGLSMLIPGAGHVYRYRAGIGFVFVSVWGMAAALTVLRGVGFVEPGLLAAARHFVPTIIAPAVAGVVWVIANLSNLLETR